MNHPGIMRAFRSTVCNFQFGAYEERYATLDTTHHRKILLFWGGNDTMVPFQLCDQMVGLIPSVTLHVLEGKSHDLPTEATEFLADKIELFFNSTK
jgi:pimeloyl-ACP methyl ester carboxylesterase